MPFLLDSLVPLSSWRGLGSQLSFGWRRPHQVTTPFFSFRDLAGVWGRWLTHLLTWSSHVVIHITLVVFSALFSSDCPWLYLCVLIIRLSPQESLNQPYSLCPVFGQDLLCGKADCFHDSILGPEIPQPILVLFLSHYTWSYLNHVWRV